LRQLILQHLQGTPDLSSLPSDDRPMIARALSKKPEDRFPTCLELIRALRAATPVTTLESAGDHHAQPSMETPEPPQSTQQNIHCPTTPTKAAAAGESIQQKFDAGELSTLVRSAAIGLVAGKTRHAGHTDGDPVRGSVYGREPSKEISGDGV